MKKVFSDDAWEQYLYWQVTDPKVLIKTNALIKECDRNPFGGTGKPEPLRGQMKGWWSRRITHEHRLVYRVTGNGDTQTLEIAACRFHYV